jgi:Flp pilus assembly protein TadB
MTTHGRFIRYCLATALIAVVYAMLYFNHVARWLTFLVGALGFVFLYLAIDAGRRLGRRS